MFSSYFGVFPLAARISVVCRSLKTSGDIACVTVRMFRLPHQLRRCFRREGISSFVCVRWCVVCWGRGSTTVKTRAYDVKRLAKSFAKFFRLIPAPTSLSHTAHASLPLPRHIGSLLKTAFWGKPVVILSFILKARTSAVTTRKKTRRFSACRCVWIDVDGGRRLERA